jgi:glycosyltransferase involved in cell wall biosynthesis
MSPIDERSRRAAGDRRVVILQGYLRPNREALFDDLNDRLAADLVVLLYGRLPRHRMHVTPNATRRFETATVEAPTVRVSYRNTLTLPRGLHTELDRLKPDLVIGGWNPASMAASRWCDRHDRRFVIWSEETAVAARQRPLNRLRHVIRTRLGQRASLGIAAGAESADYFEALGFQGPIRIVPNSIAEEEHFARIGEKRAPVKVGLRRLRFLFAGSLVKIKGLDILIKNWGALTRDLPDGAELHIAGDGPLRSDVELRVRDDTRLHYHGFLRGSAYQDLFEHCDAMLVPSRMDCNPFVVIEALWAGLPVIVSRHAGNWREALNENGFVVQPNTPSIRTAIATFASLSPHDVNQMSRMSRSQANWYSRENAARAFASAIDSVTVST